MAQVMLMRVSNTLHQIWINFGKGYVRKNIFGNSEFLIKGPSDCCSMLRGTNNVFSYFPQLLFDLEGLWY